MLIVELVHVSIGVADFGSCMCGLPVLFNSGVEVHLVIARVDQIRRGVLGMANRNIRLSLESGFIFCVLSRGMINAK
jgi:hypothetical protein